MVMLAGPTLIARFSTGLPSPQASAAAPMARKAIARWFMPEYFMLAPMDSHEDTRVHSRCNARVRPDAALARQQQRSPSGAAEDEPYFSWSLTRWNPAIVVTAVSKP
jgi:hypothetical protein